MLTTLGQTCHGSLWYGVSWAMWMTLLERLHRFGAAPSGAVSGRGASLSADDFTRLLSEHINDGVVIQDAEGHILWSNRAYERITGFSFAEIAGRKPQEFILPADRQISAREVADFRYDPSDAMFQGFEIVQNRRKSGELFWAQLSFGFFEATDRHHVIVTVRDVSEEVAANQALTQAKADLEQAVNYDALTGLANRRKLMVFLGAALRGATPDKDGVGVLHLDLDRFKDINDTYGHAAGDAVIKQAAQIMGRRAAPLGMAARIGGDEFIMVRPGLKSSEALERTAEDLISDARDPVLWDGRYLNYGFSIGMAISEPGMSRGQDLIQNADFALYEAKARGRGCWAMYDRPLRKKHRARRGMAEDLMRAVRENGLDFWYQPIVDLTACQTVGIETLARWTHPTRGIIAPEEFLAIAE
ncbi:MAG: diguanylate cyclase, partial [Pseudomonadota bacterium]